MDTARKYLDVLGVQFWNDCVCMLVCIWAHTCVVWWHCRCSNGPPYVMMVTLTQPCQHCTDCLPTSVTLGPSCTPFPHVLNASNTRASVQMAAPYASVTRNSDGCLATTPNCCVWHNKRRRWYDDDGGLICSSYTECPRHRHPHPRPSPLHGGYRWAHTACPCRAAEDRAHMARRIVRTHCRWHSYATAPPGNHRVVDVPRRLLSRTTSATSTSALTASLRLL